MHIPDGFLSSPACVGTAVLTAGSLAAAVRKKMEEGDLERQVPRMAVLSAFIFAAQMINFPVAGGTSGHLLGGALAAILLGWPTAMLIMATVVIIQCLGFYDGGLWVLGANLLNMAVLAPLVGYGVYKAAGAVFGSRAESLAIMLAGWLSVLTAAFAATVEISLFSNTVPFKLAFPAMMFWHLLIGIGEGLISVAVVSFVRRADTGSFEAQARSEAE